MSEMMGQGKREKRICQSVGKGGQVVSLLSSLPQAHSFTMEGQAGTVNRPPADTHCTTRISSSNSPTTAFFLGGGGVKRFLLESAGEGD